MEPEDLLPLRHPELVCHHGQLELLRQEPDISRRVHLARQLRWGNTTYRYYHEHRVETSESDYLE